MAPDNAHSLQGPPSFNTGTKHLDIVIDAGNVTLFAEGCRGSLSEVILSERFSITLPRMSWMANCSGNAD